MERFKETPQVATNAFTLWITPELAKAWIEHDTHNRRSAKRPIAVYQRDMDAAAWRETGETVVWDCEFQPEPPYITEGAVLLNGAHRLKSAAASEKGFPTYVVFDIPVEGQDRMDTGRKRSHADQLQLHGEANYTAVSAIARRYNGWAQGRRLYTSVLSAPVATDTDLDKVIEDNPDIRDAARIAHQNKVAYLPASLTGLAWLLFNRIDPEDCAVFFTRLSKGIDLSEDSPVWHLRERLKQYAGQQAKPREGFLFANVVKAWNQFRDGESVINFRIRTGGAAPEPFPEPR